MRTPWPRMLSAPALAGVLLVLTAAAAVAGPYYSRSGTFVIGGGFNNPVGGDNQYFNSSGTMIVGIGRHINPHFTIQGEWQHNWLAIDPQVLQQAASDSVSFDNAYASMWSITLNGVLRMRSEGSFIPWITGGFGYYKRNIQLTQNTYVYYPPVWDPWWGWVDGGWGPGEALSGQRATSGPGWNAGFGFDLPIESGASIFVDARYHFAVLDGVDMQIVPIMAGIRW